MEMAVDVTSMQMPPKMAEVEEPWNVEGELQ